jgi:hypothetical protein
MTCEQCGERVRVSSSAALFVGRSHYADQVLLPNRRRIVCGWRARPNYFLLPRWYPLLLLKLVATVVTTVNYRLLPWATTWYRLGD